MILLWLGTKNCTFGSANTETGKRSFHGSFLRFKTIEDRKWWLDNATFYGSFNAYKCNEKTGRRFDLGCSVYAYKEALNMLDYFICDDDNMPVVNS